MAKLPQTEAAVLEQSRVSLENVKNQAQISSSMAEFGYTPEEIAIGEGIYADTLRQYNLNKTEDDETSAASKLFKTKRQTLADLHKAHVKKARVAFQKDALTQDRLGIIGRQPTAYAKWILVVKKFYSEINADETIKAKIVRLKAPIEEFADATTLIAETESARAEYLREVGESEDATKQKDAAFAKLDDWMSEFYDVARIALEDHPQLLESFGLSIRS